MAKREVDVEREIQKCNKCNGWKNFEDFAKHSRMKYGIDTTCKSCILENTKKHYKENKEKIIEYQKKYYLENREYKLKYKREHYKKNREYLIEWFKEYEKNDKRILDRSIYRARRRSKIKEFKTDITADFLSNLWEKTEVCETCNKKLLNKKDAHLDHIIPLCVGGEHMKKNVRYICSSCNLQRPKDGSDINR